MHKLQLFIALKILPYSQSKFCYLKPIFSLPELDSINIRTNTLISDVNFDEYADITDEIITTLCSVHYEKLQKSQRQIRYNIN
jgi:hypothetical protein